MIISIDRANVPRDNFAKSVDLSETVTEVTLFAKIPFKTTFFGVLLQTSEEKKT